MKLGIAVKLLNKQLENYDVPVPEDVRDHEIDTLNDVVSDWLDNQNIEYVWFRILIRVQ